MTRAERRRMLRQVLEHLRRMEPRMRRAWAQSMAQARRRMPDPRTATMAQLQALAGEAMGAVRPGPIFAALRTEMQQQVQEAYVLPLRRVPGAEGPPGQVTVRVVGEPDPLVLRANRRLQDLILPRLHADLREVVRLRVQQGLERGENVRVIAQDLRNVVGLSPNMLREVDNFRAAVEGRDGRNPFTYTRRDKRWDKMLERVRAGGEQLPPATVDRMVGRYVENRLATHALTIARTATFRAYAEGQEAQVWSAVRDGELQQERVLRTWVTVGDSKVRDEHKAMEGERRFLDQPFSNGRMFPDEYNCRCILLYDVATAAEMRARAEGRELGKNTNTKDPTAIAPSAGAAPAPPKPPKPPTPAKPVTPKPQVQRRAPAAPPTPRPPVQEPPQPFMLDSRLAAPVSAREREWAAALPRNVDGIVDAMRDLRRNNGVPNGDIDPAKVLPINTMALPKASEQTALEARNIVANLFGTRGRVVNTPRTLPDGTVRREITPIGFDPLRQGKADTQSAHYQPGWTGGGNTISIPQQWATYKGVYVHELLHGAMDRQLMMVEWEKRQLARFTGHVPGAPHKPKQIPGYIQGTKGYLEKPGATGLVRDYQGRYYGDDLLTTASEFLTVAVQALVDDPVKFARDHPEMFETVMVFFYRLNLP